MHAIERAAFADPWSTRDFAECVATGVPFFVAEAAGAIAGYVIAHCAADEGEVLNLGVAERARRLGIGRALVHHVLARLRACGATAVYLEVRESNTAARLLYEGLGFREVGRRARYYHRPVEDAVVLRTAIPAETGAA